MKRFVMLALVAAFACKKQPPPRWPENYSLVTVKSGHTYKVLQVGPITEKGKPVGLGVAYVSYARSFPELVAAADELFEFAQAQAETSGDKTLAVLAKLGLDPNAKVSQSTDWNLVYAKDAAGQWNRIKENDDAPFPKVVAQKDDDERDMDAQKQAQSNVKDFLSEIDKGRIAGTWSELAKPVQKTVTVEEWTRKITDKRKDFGPVEKREKFAVVQTTNVTGAKRAKFIITRFHTRFATHQHAEEVISEMLADDGKWHLVGYALN